ncbi:zinc ribbon domain-containing protein [Dactylosporangium sp. NPDC048998]|uniref:zinc ribbon domain-containing protein n=1 Tax=Dactylosporangium sp. NPDC048998 TaxID=3363976 RepID=UPI0037227521
MRVRIMLVVAVVLALAAAGASQAAAVVDTPVVDTNDVALGHTSVMRWNDRDEWVQSDVAAHSAIIDTDSFEQVRATKARRGDRRGGPRKQYRSRNPYVFKGAVYCGVCKRKMQGQHSHDVAYYRCRFPPGVCADERRRPSAQRNHAVGRDYRAARTRGSPPRLTPWAVRGRFGARRRVDR